VSLEALRPRGRLYLRCPVHDDRTPSLVASMDASGRIRVHCFAGCDSEAVAAALGVEAKGWGPTGARPPGELWREAGSTNYLFLLDLEAQERRRPDPADAATRSFRIEEARRAKPRRFHVYEDARGRPVMAVERVHGRWNCQMITSFDRESMSIETEPGMPTAGKGLIYRLPDVLAAKGREEWVWVVEGEKDADALWARGRAATTNPMGAGGSWRPAHSEWLRGARVMVVPDFDLAGYHHAERVIRSLDGVASEVRYLELSGVPVGGDMSDWLATAAAED